MSDFKSEVRDGMRIEDLYADQWRRMIAEHPDVATGSTNRYQNWEIVDPEKWVPDGYACVRVDSRGPERPAHVPVPIIPPR